MFGIGMNKETIGTMKILDAERKGLLRKLGIESSYESEVPNMIDQYEQMLSFLPEQKQVAILKANQNMQTRIAELTEDGKYDPGVFEQAYKEMEESIKGMLTEDEHMDYLLRVSQTANLMRGQIAGFDPNEEEFLEVFNLRLAFDEENGSALFQPNVDTSKEERERYQKNLNNLNE